VLSGLCRQWDCGRQLVKYFRLLKEIMQAYYHLSGFGGAAAWEIAESAGLVRLNYAWVHLYIQRSINEWLANANAWPRRIFAHPTLLGALAFLSQWKRYDTIRDAILTCARKPTWVSLIYRTEMTTKSVRHKKLKSKNGYAQKCR